MSLRIVIVEDEFQIRHGMIHSLPWVEHDCRVVGEAADGLTGCNVIASLRPDIVISDIKMPRMDGLEMIEKTRNLYDYAAILLTGYNEFEFAKRACHIGVSEYLLKPIDEDDLFQAIESIRKKRMQIVSAMLASRYKENDSALIRLPNHSISTTITQAISYIEQHYHERFSQSMLADELKISVSTLSSAFKEETGYTLHEYLTRYRLIQAVRLLHSDELRVYEIGQSVGFPNYRYFCSVFRKYFQCAPTDYLKKK
ncbi:MAG: response regulator [Clostridia bacterium]|nr:response regulator [Clostridia bacterium]